MKLLKSFFIIKALQKIEIILKFDKRNLIKNSQINSQNGLER